jgi:hypothetical protein
MNVLANQKHTYDEVISKGIDKALRQIFGDEAKFLIYKYLETHYALKQDEITEKLDVFAKGLEEYLHSGAYVVEAKILEEIGASYGVIQRPKLENVTDGNNFLSQVEMLASAGT